MLLKEENIRISYAGQSDSLPFEATICRLFFHQAQKYGDKAFISYKDSNLLKSETWNQFSDRVIKVINFLKLTGIKKQDKVCFISKNSPDLIAYLIATLSLGAICCPLHVNLSIKQKVDLIKRFNYKTIVISDNELDLLISEIDDVKTLVNTLIEIDKPINNVVKFNYNDLLKDINNVYPDDVAYIMLSSGTTGQQKGIKLTHDNIMSNQRQVKVAWPYINENDLYFSFLPYSHSYGGLFELYQVIFNGAGCFIHDYNNIDFMIKELQEIQPTVFFAVPRVWEKLFDKIAINSLINVVNVRSVFGNKIKLGFSAGASLNSSIVKTFDDHKLPIYQGYGLTETSPSLAIATPEEAYNLNCAKILPCVDIAISECSEILVKGPNVMQGYLDENNEYKNTFIDGYFNTGDMGELLRDNYLWLKGRINDLIILSTGEKILPVNIEKRIMENEFVKYALIIGNGKPYISCILVPEYNKLSVEFKDNYKYLKNNYQNMFDVINKDLSTFEQVKKFIISSEVLFDEELTPTYKLKRSVFEKNRKGLIDQIYS